ncbi:hypothetical protein RF11_00301 [Thelohanellus kitauei]|uniref:ISXO2-like transposase domain-containing protein n=1 Tax=Thelohanellus kitauei TaxID=669202 RepID=A0A0C2N4E9_THEKT|nr:hypothetical protein RF11_00301 [Thelohanellus kitauei]
MESQKEVFSLNNSLRSLNNNNSSKTHGFNIAGFVGRGQPIQKKPGLKKTCTTSYGIRNSMILEKYVHRISWRSYELNEAGKEEWKSTKANFIWLDTTRIYQQDKLQIFIRKVPNRKAETLLPTIQSKVLPGTKIIPENWRAYNTITSMGNDYDHLVVNNRLNFVNPRDPSERAQNIEKIWSCVTRKFRSTIKSRYKRTLGISEFLCNESTRKIDFAAFFTA